MLHKGIATRDHIGFSKLYARFRIHCLHDVGHNGFLALRSHLSLNGTPHKLGLLTKQIKALLSELCTVVPRQCEWGS